MTIWHLRDIQGGKRRKVKGKDVKIISVPQYEGLTIEDMLNFAQNHRNVMNALPVEEKEILKLPRSYIANVINTIISPDDAFRLWVKSRVNERHSKQVQDRGMIEMDPEIAEVYRQSQAISGKSLVRLILTY